MAGGSAASTEKPGWKIYMVLILLSLGYFGKYYCTSDMYIVQRLVMSDEGISMEQMSWMFAIGYATSMVGKVVAGTLCDSKGGKFVIAMSASGFAVCTVLLSIIPSGMLVPFLFVWGCNGFFALGLAWVAVVAVATNWVPSSHLGRLMALLSMAPQLGDAIARLTLAHWIHDGWRKVFQVAALSSVALVLPTLLFVGNSPEGAVTDTPAAKGGKEQEPYGVRLKKLLLSPFLWVLCLLSGSLYGTRTLFLLYSTSFLSSAYCNSAEDPAACMHDPDTLKMTAKASSAYTILGCVSVYLVGVLKDKLPQKHRGATLAVFVVPLFVIMCYLTHTGADLPFEVAATLVALIGFCLFGPYKVLGAVFAVDVGGKELKSTCTAFMGVFDNFFAMVMLIGKGAIGNDWTRMFAVLTGLSAMSAVSACFVWTRDLSVAKRAQAREPLLAA